MQHLPHKIVKRSQVDSPHGDACVRNIEQFAPQFFLRCMQTDNHDRMRLHCLSWKTAYANGIAGWAWDGYANLRCALARVTTHTAIVSKLDARCKTASVAFCTYSAVTPGATSSSTRPSGRTSITPNSVTISETTPTPVSGRLHFLTILGSPSLVVCSIAMITRFAPATKAIAPPIPFNIFPGIAQFARFPFSSTCNAPSTGTLMRPLRIIPKESELEK